MPLRVLLVLAVLFAPMPVSAADADEPEKKEDLHLALVTQAREGFLALKPIQEIWTREKLAELKPEGANPESLKVFEKIKFGMPFIRAVQKQLANPEERYRAFLALDIEDNGTLYREWEKPVIPEADRKRFEKEAEVLKAKYDKEKLDPKEQSRVDSRMAQIAKLLGTGPSAETLPGGAGVIQAGMGPTLSAGQAAQAYLASGGNAHTYKTLQTNAVKPPAAAAPRPEFKPYKPPGTLERVWDNLKGIELRLPEAADYFEGNQARLIAAIEKDAERMVADPNYKHSTFDGVYQNAPERYQKAAAAWQIVSQSRYGGEQALAKKYGIEMTDAEVADVDHFYAGATVSPGPGPGTVAGILGTVVYDGVQVGRDVAKGNWKSAKYNLAQVWTDIKGVAYGASLIPTGLPKWFNDWMD